MMNGIMGEWHFNNYTNTWKIDYSKLVYSRTFRHDFTYKMGNKSKDIFENSQLLMELNMDGEASLNPIQSFNDGYNPQEYLTGGDDPIKPKAQGGGGMPKNAQEVLQKVLSMNLKLGQTVDGGSLNSELYGISLTKYSDGFNIKINSYFKEKAAQVVGFDSNNRFTISATKWVDGKTDVIKYQERYKGTWGLQQYIHNDGVKYLYKINETSFPFKFGNQYLIGNGKW
jgi:hypothetical protein